MAKFNPGKNGFIPVGQLSGYAVNHHGTSNSITIARQVLPAPRYREYMNGEGIIVLVPVQNSESQ